MNKKHFNKPECEVVRFENRIITASSCGCYVELIPEATDCLKDDIPICTCQVNHIAGTANCTPCEAYE